MQIEFGHAIEILARTPATLRALLGDLPEAWTASNEGPETWSPYDVVAHLIHGEQTDWIPRARMIVEHGADRAFEPFDRFAQFAESAGKNLSDLLNRFEVLRRQNLQALRALNLSEADFGRVGKHPALGTVTLGQLLATWTVHDLNHIGQIVQVMARQYTDAVGPWKAYLSILDRPASEEG